MDDKRLERIEAKLDDVSDHLSSIDITLAKQHESLRIHIKRSDLLEKKLQPVEKHVDMVQGALKLLTILGILATLVSTILHLYKVI